MANEWVEVKLSDLGEVARGRSRHRPRYAEHLYGGNYPFIQTGDVKASNGRINTHQQTYSEAGLAQSRLWPKNTMCITIAANIAETGILQYPACFPDSVIGFIADESKADVYFIEYLFRKLRKDIQRQASGSVQDNINLQTIERLKFNVPPVHEQRRIAIFLNVFEDKITLNRQINQTLEQMAQALFKSWFVDFDPVVDNALDAGFFEQNSDLPEELLRRAEQRKIVRQRPDFKPLPAETRQLFPAAFEECEEPSLGLGGWVPKGWKILQLKDLSEKISKGTTPRSRDIEVAKDDLASVLFVKVKDMTDDNRVRLDNLESIPKSVSSGVLKRSVLCEGDILLSIAGTIGRIASVEKELDGSNCNQAVAFLRPKDKKTHHLFIKQTLQSERVRQYIDSKVVQAVQANFSLTHFGEIQTVLPSDQVIQKFNLSATTYSSRTISNLRQIDVLTRLRDTLLPKLISGELRLSDDGTLASGNTDC